MERETGEAVERTAEKVDGKAERAMTGACAGMRADGGKAECPAPAVTPAPAATPATPAPAATPALAATPAPAAWPAGCASKPASPFIRAANEDDDGYDPYSDRPARTEPLFERDPWS